MSSYRAWKGAIEFSGFPVQLGLYSRVKGSKNLSFRQLSPAGNPIQQKLVDSVTGDEVARADLAKGYEVSKGEYVVMTDEALAQIDSGVKTELAPAVQFAPASSIDWHLATSTYAVRALDQPGQASALNIVWNGLRETGLAYVAQVSLRGGADAILAIRADQSGMWASLIPFADELYDLPEPEFHPDSKAAGLFAQVLDTEAYEGMVRPFEHEAYASEYKARRAAAIESVLAGEPVPVSEPTAPAVAAPDLMATLMAAADSRPSKAAVAAKSKRKVKAA